MNASKTQISEDFDIKSKLIEELNLIPDEKLSQIYNFIHFYRLGLEFSESGKKSNAEEIMKYAGIWKDMPDEEFEDLMREIYRRREPSSDNDMTDPIIQRVRDARKAISEKCDHDPKKLVQYYLERQKKHKSRLADYSDQEETNETVSES